MDSLLAALPGNSTQYDTLREGLAVGQGRWPTDRYLLTGYENLIYPYNHAPEMCVEQLAMHAMKRASTYH